jgi:hypothetical protein
MFVPYQKDAYVSLLYDSYTSDYPIDKLHKLRARNSTSIPKIFKDLTLKSKANFSCPKLTVTSSFWLCTATVGNRGPLMYLETVPTRVPFTLASHNKDMSEL